MWMVRWSAVRRSKREVLLTSLKIRYKINYEFCCWHPDILSGGQLYPVDPAGFGSIAEEGRRRRAGLWRRRRGCAVWRRVGQRPDQGHQMGDRGFFCDGPVSRLHAGPVAQEQ